MEMWELRNEFVVARGDGGREGEGGFEGFPAETIKMNLFLSSIHLVVSVLLNPNLLYPSSQPHLFPSPFGFETLPLPPSSLRLTTVATFQLHFPPLFSV